MTAVTPLRDLYKPTLTRNIALILFVVCGPSPVAASDTDRPSESVFAQPTQGDENRIRATANSTSHPSERMHPDTPPSQLFIQHEPSGAPHHESLIVGGYFETFVRCGSQLSIWFGFPMAIRFKVTVAESEEAFTTLGFPENISHDQYTYNYYGQLPCDKVIRKEFSVDLTKERLLSLPNGARVVAVEAEYLGTKSNVLQL